MTGIIVSDVVKALDRITGGRLVTDLSQLSLGQNTYVMIKSSGIPGKEVMEFPGLVWGNPQKAVSKIAVVMTLTESVIELAGSTGVDLIVVHHPVADAASSGGVPLKHYLSTYDLAVIELHEAFHGLHPGIPFLHGHTVFRFASNYGEIPGNGVFFGKPLPDIKTVRDIIDRLNSFMNFSQEDSLLSEEKKIRECPNIQETISESKTCLYNGDLTSPVRTVVHFAPHGGFNPDLMERAIMDYPDVNTAICSISRLLPDNSLVKKAVALKLNLIVGNTHALEIFENGLPLAFALSVLLPGADIRLFRERVTSIPFSSAGNKAIQKYAEQIAAKYLLRER